jgi:predicted MFS family arabinose efflux permease
MGAVFSAAAFLSITRPVMDDWQAATIPETLRGRYLGRRIQLLGFVTIASMLAAGMLGDWAGQQGSRGLSFVLAAGSGFGLLAILSLRHAHDSGHGVAPVSVSDIPQVFRTRDFRRLLIGYVLYNLPFFFACPFYQVLNKQALHMTNTNIAWMASAYCLVKMISSRTAGRLLDRFGARHMAFVVGPLYALFFLSLPFATPERHWPIYVAWACVGSVDTMFALCIQTGLMASVPAQGPRPAYFAVYNLTALGLYGIGGPLTELAMRLIGPGVWALGPLLIGRYQILYATCGIVMLGTTFAALLWPRPSRSPAGGR